jgi:MFS family permease
MVAALLMGVGTAFVYPTLLAVVADVADPSRRASAIGTYRLWRDLGYAIGGLTTGVIADAVSMRAAFVVVAAMTGLSGIVVATRMDAPDHVRFFSTHTLRPWPTRSS